MLKTINENLRNITDTLGGLNYGCSIEILELPITTELNRVTWLKSLLGSKTKVYGLEESTFNNIETVLEMYLNYDKKHPLFTDDNELHLSNRSEKYKQVIEEIKKLFNGYNEISQVDLSSDSYPMYAVFWKFAFFISVNDNGYLLIGAASD